MIFSRVIISLFFLLIVFSTCHSDLDSEKSRESDKFFVVSSIFPLGDLVKNIVGDTEARFLLPPRVSPHSFEPSPKAMKRLKNVKIAFLIGGGLDDWAGKLIQHENKNGIKVIYILPKLKAQLLYQTRHHHDSHSDHHSGRSVDPHVWLDPVIMKEIAEIVTREVTSLMPQKAGDFNRNCKKYINKLNKLDQDIKKAIGQLTKKEYISVHGAFQYFAKRYGLVEAAVIAPYPGKEPSISWMKQLIQRAKSLRVKTILAEPQLSNKSANMLAKELGGKVIIVDPIGDPAVTERNSYIKLMIYNLNRFLDMK